MLASFPVDASNTNYVVVADSKRALRAHKSLVSCIETDILPGTGLSSGKFWSIMDSVVLHFTKENYDLLKFRDSLQLEIDEWYRSGRPTDQEDFLRKIGYLVKAPSCDEMCITTAQVDPEIAAVASPQLVVPIDNDRFVVNAINSRWGSLSAAVSTTDVIGKDPSKEKVIDYIQSFLDQSIPLLGRSASWKEVAYIGASRLGGSKGAH